MNVVLRSDAVENSTSADHQVWVERGDVGDVGLGYPSVDAQHHFPPIDQFPGCLHATGRTGDKLLPAPAGVYGQQEDEVDVVDERLDRLHRRAGVYRDAP